MTAPTVAEIANMTPEEIQKAWAESLLPETVIPVSAVRPELAHLPKSGGTFYGIDVRDLTAEEARRGLVFMAMRLEHMEHG